MIDRALVSDHFISLRIDVDQLEEVQHELIEPLRSPDVFADIPPTGSGIPVTDFPAYIELVKDTVTVARFVAGKVIAWRHRRRQQGKPIGIRISRPGKAPINLEIATDEEITIYITDGREQE
jgi:hypothetical protein